MALASSPERASELVDCLAEIKTRVQRASSSSSTPTLIAVSKYKPPSDILTCYENGQIDFGENYVQELVDKAEQLPREIQWHFIGTLQSNKAKILAAIPNLNAIQTLTSEKAATALDKALPVDRSSPLNVFIQINTSGESSKSGLSPLSLLSAESVEAELPRLARHIVQTCPRLRLKGLMTIGSLEQSLGAEEENQDFKKLRDTRDALQHILEKEFGAGEEAGRWGEDRTGRLLLSMGMSSDFEAAIKGGSDIVRVGTGIFGGRPPKS